MHLAGTWIASNSYSTSDIYSLGAFLVQQRRQIVNLLSKIEIEKKPNLELCGILQFMEIWLKFEGLVQILKELPLKGNDLLNVTEKGIDLCVGEKRLSLQGLQIIL